MSQKGVLCLLLLNLSYFLNYFTGSGLSMSLTFPYDCYLFKFNYCVLLYVLSLFYLL